MRAGGKSPLIIEDLEAYAQLPRTTGALTLTSEEPPIARQSRLKYALTTRGNRVGATSSSCWMLGRAMFTIESSSTTINWAEAITSGGSRPRRSESWTSSIFLDRAAVGRAERSCSGSPFAARTVMPSAVGACSPYIRREHPGTRGVLSLSRCDSVEGIPGGGILLYRAHTPPGYVRRKEERWQSANTR